MNTVTPMHPSANPHRRGRCAFALMAAGLAAPLVFGPAWAQEPTTGTETPEAEAETEGAATDGRETETVEQDAVPLQPIIVEGDVGVVTEGTGSYTTGRATVGSRLPAEVRDVPQAITVITRQRLDDANANSLEEAGYLIPNVSVATGDLFSGSLYARGHEVFTYSIDGAPRPFLAIYGTSPDLVFFDRVEVLSGPSGLFQGSGEPVGTINLVRKRPLDDFAISAAAAYGSFDAYRGEVDLSAPLREDGSLRTRIVAYGETEESFVDITEQDRFGFYGTVELDLTDRTTLAFGTILEDQQVVRFSGLPTFTDGTLIDLDRSTFVGAPFNDFHTETYEGFADLEHRFDSGGVLRLVGRYYTRLTDLENVLGRTGVDPATGNFSLFTFAREFEEDAAYLDANFTQPFSVFDSEVTVTAGADFRHTNQVTRQNFDFTAGVQNIFDFDPFIIPDPKIEFPGTGPGFRLNTETTATEYGAYAQARVDVTDRLALTLGGRLAHYVSETHDLGRNRQTSDLEATRFVPFAGLSFDVIEEVTTYVSYSEIFQPQTELRFDGSQLDPILGRQVETGAKASFLDGDLTAQAAVYWLRDENRAQDDPVNTGFFISAPETDTYGFEALIAGSPIDGLDITLGYNFVETELTTDPTPRHSVTAFGNYTFESGYLEGLNFGLGARAVGPFDARAGDITIAAPGYVVVDAVVGYEIAETVQVQLFFENLLDRTYIDRINQTSRGTFYGEPFNVTARLGVSF